MNEIANKLYTLLHITSLKNYEKIQKQKRIIPSKHDITNHKLQWLGDGIYFWDSNDDFAIERGVNLVGGKYHTKACVGIYVSIELDYNKHMNLEKGSWLQLYTRFLKTAFPEYYENMLDYMDMIRNQNKIDTATLNKIGELTGTTINLFLKVLLEQENIEISMVSGCFFHGKNKLSLFKSQEKTIRQYCIKDESLVNDISDTWKIKYNIKG